MGRFIGYLVWLALLLVPAAAAADPEAKLIFFTEDGTETGVPLLPGFPLHSVWSGLGQSDDGRIFVAVSDHEEVAGNVAVFAMDPDVDRFRFLTDLKSVSEAAGNWKEGEGQYKVHTFLQQASDGLIYFATMPASDPRKQRGSHLYTLDPATETIRDISTELPATLTRQGALAPNRGVIVEALGIKGMSLNPKFEDMIYVMTHDIGFVFRLDLRNGQYHAVGFSSRVSYVMHTDAEGDLYFLGSDPEATSQALLQFDAQSGETSVLIPNIPMDEEIGMIVPTANPDVVMVLMSKSKEVFPINTKAEKRLRGGTSCGKNWWKLFNMAVSPDGRHLYFVSNNNNHPMIWRAPTGGGTCQQVLDVKALLGTRNLAFGGQNIWVGDSFFTPVWTHQGDNDLAILKVTVK